jgi:hypothetical protein
VDRRCYFANLWSEIIVDRRGYSANIWSKIIVDRWCYGAIPLLSGLRLYWTGWANLLISSLRLMDSRGYLADIWSKILVDRRGNPLISSLRS